MMKAMEKRQDYFLKFNFCVPVRLWQILLYIVFDIFIKFFSVHQKGTENYDESNGKKTGSTKKPGENFKENDGLSEELSRWSAEKDEPSHDQKGVKRMMNRKDF